MFTGIVTAIGHIIAIADTQASRTLTFSHPYRDIAPGDSIACAGVCLTVETLTKHPDPCTFTATLSAETLARTTLGQSRQGDRLNLELALRVGDRFGGHIVSGHVDGIGTITAIHDTGITGAARQVDFHVPSSLIRFIAAKGSLAIDGVSMTVNAIAAHADGGSVSVAIIPHSWEQTTWHDAILGRSVNLEVDLMARHIVHALETTARLNPSR